MQSSLSYWSPSGPAPSPPLHPSLYRRRCPQSRHSPPSPLLLGFLSKNSTNMKVDGDDERVHISGRDQRVRLALAVGVRQSLRMTNRASLFSCPDPRAPNVPLGTKFILLSIWFRIMSCRYFWQFTSRKLCTQFFQPPPLRVSPAPLPLPDWHMALHPHQLVASKTKYETLQNISNICLKAQKRWIASLIMDCRFCEPDHPLQNENAK